MLIGDYIKHIVETNVDRYGTNATLTFETCREISGDRFTGEALVRDCDRSTVELKVIAVPFFAWSDKGISFDSLGSLIKDWSRAYIVQFPFDDEVDYGTLKQINIEGIGDLVVRGVRYSSIELDIIDVVVLAELKE